MRKAPAGIAELALGRRTQYITVSSSQQSPYNTQNGSLKKTIFLQIFYLGQGVFIFGLSCYSKSTISCASVDPGAW